MSKRVAIQLIIHGKVQGVGFRRAAYRKAISIGGIEGYVRNLPDGDVEVFIQGIPICVQELINWCQDTRATPGTVEKVTQYAANMDENLKSFEIFEE